MSDDVSNRVQSIRYSVPGASHRFGRSAPGWHWTGNSAIATSACTRLHTKKARQHVAHRHSFNSLIETFPQAYVLLRPTPYSQDSLGKLLQLDIFEKYHISAHPTPALALMRSQHLSVFLCCLCMACALFAVNWIARAHTRPPHIIPAVYFSPRKWLMVFKPAFIRTLTCSSIFARTHASWLQAATVCSWLKAVGGYTVCNQRQAIPPSHSA